MQKKEQQLDPYGYKIGIAIFAVLVALVLGTIVGAWYRLFWLGWVLAG